VACDARPLQIAIAQRPDRFQWHRPDDPAPSRHFACRADVSAFSRDAQTRDTRTAYCAVHLYKIIDAA
jgi:hypothetical protein